MDDEQMHSIKIKIMKVMKKTARLKGIDKNSDLYVEVSCLSPSNTNIDKLNKSEINEVLWRIFNLCRSNFGKSEILARKRGDLRQLEKRLEGIGI
jgi:hypothetical protein